MSVIGFFFLKKMIIHFSDKEYNQAVQKAKHQGLLKNNQSGTRGVINGLLGEICLYKYIKKNNIEVLHSNTKDFDFLINHLKFEIKTKQTRSLHLKSFYTNRVSSHNPNQKCDYYIFLRIMYKSNNTGSLKFCGACTKTSFLNKSIYKDNYFHIKMKNCFGFKHFMKLIDTSQSKEKKTNISINKLINILLM